MISRSFPPGEGYQGAAITALPLAQRPVPGSDRKPPEVPTIGIHRGDWGKADGNLVPWYF